MNGAGDVGHEITLATRLKIEANIRPNLSIADSLNGIPLLNALTVHNPTDTSVGSLELVLTSEPPVFHPKIWRLDSLPPGITSIPITELEIDRRELTGLTERVAATIAVGLRNLSDSEPILESTYTVDLLPKNHWGGLTANLPEIIAAFSQPNDPSIDRLLKQAAHALSKAGHPNQLNGYLDGSGHAWLIANAIWLTVVNQQFTYILPPMGFEEAGQKIRTPESMVQSRVGTCLDLTMLFTALMEQASLHPVVVFTQGHAFPGFWTTPKPISATVIDDPAQIRNAIELNELILFESTLVTQSSPISFTEAIQTGSKNVESDDDFILMVDIHQSRKSGIRPLASSGSTPNDKTAIEENQPEAISLEPVPVSLQAAPPVLDDPPPTTPQGRLDHWQKKLLDLSLRNRLLNFRTSKKTLRIEIESAGEIEDLIASGRKVKFSSVAGYENSRSGSTQARLESLETDASLKNQIARALEGNTLLTKKSTEETNTTLLQLFREAKTAQEEGGANTLFLAFGYLSWQKSGDSSRSYLAPLLLVPVTIDRRTARSGFTIRSHDDGPRFNPTLVQMLQIDFRIHLPISEHELPQDGHGIDIDTIWQRVRQSIRDQRGWEVIERVDLATFSFSKHLMWKDLVDRKDELAKNLVVKQLLEGTEEPFPDQGAFPEESALDTNYPPEKVYTPLPVDSSQLATVLAASKGQSFVVIGPPGTGKSQTIANVISQTLGEGKTILFVSEKIAALEVVYRRLKQIGLGDYCLELHSNKANKRGVLDQLNRAWHREGGRPEREDWQAKSKHLEALRRDLNAYVGELHLRRDNGMTLFEAFGRSTSLDHLPEIMIDPTPNATDSQEHYQTLETAASRLQQARETLPPGVVNNEALMLFGAEAWTPDLQDQVLHAANTFLSHVKEAISSLEGFCAQAGIDEGYWTAENIDHALQFAEPFTSIPDIELGIVADEDVTQLLERILEAARRSRDIQAHELVLSSWWNPPDVKADIGTPLAELLEKARRLSVTYTNDVETLDFDKLQSDWDAANSKFLFKGRAKTKVEQDLAQGTERNAAPDVEKDVVLLARMVALKSQLTTELQTMRSQVAPFSDLDSRAPSLWQGASTDLETIHWAQSFIRELNSLIASRPSGSSPVIRSNMKKILGSTGSDRLAFVEQALLIKHTVMQMRHSQETLLSTLMSSDEARTKFRNLDLRSQEQLCAQLVSDSHYLRIWSPWNRALSHVVSVGLGTLVDAVTDTSLLPQDILQTFQANYARLWARAVTTATPTISGFNGRNHELKIDDFQDIDETYADLSAQIVELRVRSNTPEPRSGGKSSPTGILLREIEKKSRHKPIRTLMESIPDLVTSITPCFMMSPLSIAQYLPAHASPFDVVVFDEASQIPVWDAVGAIARGKQVIMVGDTKQLPPTSFFNRADSEDSEDSFEEDLPSILDECVASSMPQRKLNWHYRSRHESLIAFSNRKYYDGKLVTFPSPVTEDMAVSSTYVNGVYERGTSRTNPKEARAVVREVVAHLRSDPEDTIGIVTFNLQQKELIEELLDKERRDDSSLEYFFGSDVIEPVMVKNLENVQGDERDVIFFSTTFGHDSAGKMYMNFGPLNRTGGERRLNVAITRARKQLRVFTSIRPEDIVITGRGTDGVRHFKTFLDYANRGIVALDAEGQSSNGEADSPFETSVANALRDLGWEVRQQIGVSGFRIDLAIVDPDAPGGYLAGIECDGATYHSSATARDRDKVRESVLRGLGWEILRVWSTDWFYAQRTVLDRLHGKLTELYQEHQARRIVEKSNNAKDLADDTPEQGLEVVSSHEISEPHESVSEKGDLLIANQALSTAAKTVKSDVDTSARDARAKLAAETFRFATPDRFSQDIHPDDFYDASYTPILQAIITHVIDAEGPILDVDLINTVRSWHGWNRSGARIRQRVLEAVPKDHATTIEEDDTGFYWPGGSEPAARIPFRRADGVGNQRTSTQIAMPELIDLAAYAGTQSTDHETVVRVMCEELGIERLSASTRRRLETAIKESTKSKDEG